MSFRCTHIPEIADVEFHSPEDDDYEKVREEAERIGRLAWEGHAHIAMMCLNEALADDDTLIGSEG